MKKYREFIIISLVIISFMFPPSLVVMSIDNISMYSQSSVDIVNLRASTTSSSTVETKINFNGKVNKTDTLVLTYTAEAPYNERIFNKFVNSLTFNDTAGVFDYQTTVINNQLIVTITPKVNNLVSPLISIGFERESLHGDISETDCEFSITNTYEYGGETKNAETILINSLYYDFNQSNAVYTGIDGANSPLVDKACIGFEDVAHDLADNSLFNDPFIYLRNTTTGIFIPQYVIKYNLVSNTKVPSKIRFYFKLSGPGSIDLPNVHLYRLNRTVWQETSEPVTLLEDNGTYYYEVETGNDGITQEELFAFGMKVENLDFDNPTILEYTTKLVDANDELIIDSWNINAITFSSASGVTSPPILTTRNDFSVLVGESPNYKEDLNATYKKADGTVVDITDDVVIDDSAVDLNTAGDYVVTYTVTDPFGNTTSKSITVTVIDSEITIVYKSDSGASLGLQKIPSQQPGTSFSATSPTIPGYELVNNQQAIVTGTHTNSPQLIEVIYKKEKPMLNLNSVPLNFDFSDYNIWTGSSLIRGLDKSKYASEADFHIELQDKRPVNSGWKLTAMGEELSNPKGTTLPSITTIAFDVALNEVNASGALVPPSASNIPQFGSLVTGNTVVIPMNGSSGTLLSAQTGKGKGIFDIGIDFNSVQIRIPGDSHVREGELYRGNIHFSLDDVL